MGVESSRMGAVASLKRPQQGPPSLLPCEHTAGKTAAHEPGSGPPQVMGQLVPHLGLPTPGTVKMNVLFISHLVYGIVKAARTD